MATKKSTSSPCSISSVVISFTLLCILLLFIFSLSSTTRQPKIGLQIPDITSQFFNKSIRVYVADLPRSLNYDLLAKYWSLNGDSRLGRDEDSEIRSTLFSKSPKFPPYPENPLIKQYSAEYWIMGDLMTPDESRTGSFAKRVSDINEADVLFVPFFATLSAELQLSVAKGAFRKKMSNEDYERQRQVVDFVKGTDAWKKSGGRDHVFVLTGYVKT